MNLFNAVVVIESYFIILGHQFKEHFSKSFENNHFLKLHRACGYTTMYMC